MVTYTEVKVTDKRVFKDDQSIRLEIMITFGPVRAIFAINQMRLSRERLPEKSTGKSMMLRMYRRHVTELGCYHFIGYNIAITC